MTGLVETLSAALRDRYRIEHELGAGGTAIVYAAHDLRHGRRVAIKVLRPELAVALGADRFLAEIDVTAGLAHPHILGLIDSGAVDGAFYYVMPLVDGVSLRHRLTREGKLSIEETVRIVNAVADALDYAHRRGVVHRDIKPENILLLEGHAMVADFGIALAVERAGGNRLTESGYLVGTPLYMSPEQASGEKIDARSDIYSLGCVAYEMLAGAPPYEGSTIQAILTAAVTTEPTPLRVKRASVPDHVAAAIETAIEKAPADRFATAGAFAESLLRPTELTRRRIQRLQAAKHQSSLRPGVAASMVIAALALGMLAGWWTFGRGGAAAQQARYWNIVLPSHAPLALTGPGPLGVWQAALALAPEGDVLAYVAPKGATTTLVVRRLDRDSAVVLAGTDGAYHPFFSPDGSWIGYFSGSELRKVAVTGGSSVTLATVERPSGATWPSNDHILLFQQDGFQMRWISASGGVESSVTLGTQFGTPHPLPGGDWVVGQLGSGQLGLLSLADTTQLAVTRRGVVPLDSVTSADLLFGASPVFVSTGHLVFGSEDGVLMALPFDGRSRRVLGNPAAVVSGIRIEEGFGFAEYALSRDGTLVFAAGRSQLYGQIAFVNQGGRLDTLPFPRAQYTQPRMSPDGTRLAAQVRKPVGGWDVLIMDLATGVRQRVPVEADYRAFPAAWFPDGQTLMIGLWDPVRFATRGAKLYALGSGAWEDVEPFDGSYMTVAPNGQEFVASDWRTGELFTRRVRGDTTKVRIPARGFAASFSPDGRWLAWGGVDGGIAVSPLPPTGAIHAVVERGQQPLWSPDGRRLIYRDGRRFFEVPVNTEGGFRVGMPRLLAEGPFIRTFAWNHTIAPDGRVAALVSHPGESAGALGVIAGFHGELERLAPPRPR